MSNCPVCFLPLINGCCPRRNLHPFLSRGGDDRAGPVRPVFQMRCDVMKSLKKTWLAVCAMVTFMFGWLTSTQAFAQIPTGLPTEVTAGIDDLYLLIGAASAGILGVLAVITLAKWARAMFS